MSTNFRRLFIAGLCLIPATILSAQETKQRGKADRDPARTETRTSETQTTERAATDRAAPTRGAPGATDQRGGGDLDQFLVATLRGGNQKEIAVSELGREQASDREVKAFAEQMIQEHTQFLSKLDQVSGSSGRVARQPGAGSRTESSTRTDSTRSTTTTQGTNPSNQKKKSSQDQSNQQNQDRANDSGDRDRDSDQDPDLSGRQDDETTPRTAASDRSDSEDEQAVQLGQAGQAGKTRSTTTTTGQVGRRELSRRDVAAGAHGTADGSVAKIIQIKEELTKQCIESAQRELSQKQGREFDKCFMGMQVAAHMEMLDTLTVYKNHASSELQQVIEEGLQTTKQHLEHAKQLAKKTDQGSSRGANPAAAGQDEDGSDAN